MRLPPADGLDREVEVVVVSGPEGPSLYIADFRVAGPKPWGGGTILHSWSTTLRDLLYGMVGYPQVKTEADTNDALAWHDARRKAETPMLLAALERRSR